MSNLKIRRYRKIQGFIEAVQYDGTPEMAMDILQWLQMNDVFARYEDVEGDQELAISTIEGEMRVDPGSWVCRGESNDFWPVRDDIFQKRYEVADEDQAAES